MSRFLSIAAFVTSSLLVPTLLTTGCTSDPGSEAELEVHTYTSGSDGFDTSTYWIDTGKEVVVFDAQFTPEIARDELEQIRAATLSPIRYVVVTHPNPDKFNGATVFQEAGARLVTSQATADSMPDVHEYKKAYFVSIGMFTEESYPELPQVDLTFEDTLQLDLEAEVDITLVRLQNPGVSSTQTVALLPGNRIIVGDLVAGNVHAWLEGGIVNGAPTPTMDGWQLALNEVRELVGDDGEVYPGRGTSGPAGELIPAQQAYLQTMRALVREYVEGLENPTAQLTGEEAPSHYAAITVQAEAAFPEYGLSYLVNYGVYGLALAEAAAVEAL